MNNAQIQLFNQMLNAFDEAELRELAFMLDIHYEDLNGENRRAKAVSLVQYCNRANRLSELIDLCHEKRPTLSWPSVADQQADRYDIQEELGEGAFAAVYKARDRKLGRTVAIKILHEHLRWEVDNIERFNNEASSVSRLNHPGIVTIYDRGEMNGRFFITMNYIDGQTLRQYLYNNAPLSQAETVKILRPIADALDYAHAQGIVHRDIKPNNIMIEDTDHRLKATLLDFGLVKAVDGTVDLTSMGVTLGTPEYMSPEQADPGRRAEIGPATDRYALGIVAYQMLTGRVPFEGNTSATLYAHEYKPVPPPQELRPDLPDYAAKALVKMLAKDRADRYESATAFVQALDPTPQVSPPQVASQMTPTPKPPKVQVPLWVWAVVGIGLLALITLVIWQPWVSITEDPQVIVTETPTARPTIEPISTSEETAVSPPVSTTDGTIDTGQTVNGKIIGAGTETWSYIGYEGRVDIRVEGSPEDRFVLILYYPDGRQADYIDYSGQGEGELLTYYEIEPGFKIEVDEIENDGAEYTLTVTDSATNYIWPSAAFSGAIRGANPEIYIFGEELAVVDIIVEMDETDLPFLAVYKQNGRELISTDQVDENGRLTLENLELDGYHEIVIRDMANDGAEFSIEMNESEE